MAKFLFGTSCAHRGRNSCNNTYIAPQTCSVCSITVGEPLPKTFVDLSSVTWSVENGGRIDYFDEITESVMPYLPEGITVISYAYEMGGDFHDSIYSVGDWKVYATVGANTEGGYSEEAYELSTTELIIEFTVYDSDATEPEPEKDHSKCESTKIERIIMAIFNFFRRLFGMPVQCICGDEIG